ncbi:flagellar basal body rod protein FlgC [Desulfovibrio ferrophilus]|uniref:Flagellar basal body rod protein n=1 Tax=Desulfovibrio ferrophilus TaxID=241368 RepID=A0A2Z6AXG0_9BACT|nr:flagellar basal body rod C-terminal domain-containing protein [Desulfovibrio ferrophilus]BBD07929.1 uncharacterized protein DFE_1203 [Desulfovibrio ferrophilus]
MVSTMDTALSALNAFSVDMAVTANNIANANTEEFNPSRVILEERPDMGGVAVQDIQEMDVQAALVETIRPELNEATGLMEQSSVMVEASGTDIATETVNMIMNQRAFEANAAVVRTQDEMIGQFMDEMV